MDSLNQYSELIVDPKKIKEYIDKNINETEKEEIDLKKIRNNLGKLVKDKIDWTQNKKCKISIFLYLKQNNQ